MDREFIDQANDVTNKVAAWLRSLIDQAEDGATVAIERLAPVVGELQRLFADPADPLPEGAGEPPTSEPATTDSEINVT
jgi:ABC-type transporter Mla subunit MlaD